MSEWFSDWFNSHYYHLLYAYRNQQEADHFISELVTKLKLKPASAITDLGCGEGRHCRALYTHGMNVTGIDLSENSISQAKKNSSPAITYYTHDMRKPLPVKNQDVILSLFTSFGYFDTLEESLLVIRNIEAALKPNGMLLLDYLNAMPLYNMPAQTFEQRIDDIQFTITKHATQTHVFKTITVNDKGRICTYAEKVALYNLGQLSDFLQQTGFQIINTFGDYMFSPYHLHSSPRLILQAIKK